MVKPTFESVDAYIAAQPEAVRPLLERVRGTIRRGAPAAEEAISYQIPTYRLHGKRLIYFAGHARHYALYPVTQGILAELGDEAASLLSGKATMRFALDGPVPVELIARIVKARVTEVEADKDADGPPATSRVASR